MEHAYEKRGASASKKDIRRIVDRLPAGEFPGAFCKIVPDILAGDENSCLVQHSDGVGTKSTIAYLLYRQYRDPSVFRSLAIDSLVMNLDDMLAVGCTGPFVLNNVIGRNAKLLPEEVVSEVINGYEEYCEFLADWGIEILPAGGETADCGDIIRSLVVDSTLTARIARDAVIDCSTVEAGHEIIALASFGKSRYETRYNSGVGTNGFTCLRHELLDASYRVAYPETFAPEIREHSYNGQLMLESPVPGCDLNLGEALMCPTRTFMPVFARLGPETRQSISAIFHNTGGGLTKCLGFGTGIRYVKNDLFPLPPFFEFVRENVSLSWREMCEIFNLGQRLEIVCDPAASSAVLDAATELGIAGRVIGYTEAAVQNSLRIEIGGEVIEYEP